MDEAIKVLDWQRMFLGDLPWTFGLEIIIRTAVMYLYALVLIRFMGKRGMKQLSPFDFAIIIALGSAVGDPMFYPQVPLVHGMIVLTTIVALERSLAYLVNQYETVESFVEGTPQRLVVDGRLDLKGMQIESLAREELFTMLRVAGVEQLGQVRRAYLEQTGDISIFLYTPVNARAGLSLIPPWDIFPPANYPANTRAPFTGFYACLVCGETIPLAQDIPLPPCLRCGGDHWTKGTDHLLTQDDLELEAEHSGVSPRAA